jgi:small-conductance mechanosensitive channel
VSDAAAAPGLAPVGDELGHLLARLTRASALEELAFLALCFAAAWGLVRLLRGKESPPGSIWYGKRIVDGVLFPVLALGFAYVAKITTARFLEPAVFKLAIPILISLVVIRLSVRVLSASLPDSRWVRAVEKSISWLAWIAVVLWVTGLLPLVLSAMDDVSWSVGSTRLTLRNLVEGTVTAGLVMVLTLWVSAAIERKLLRGSGDSLSVRKIAANLVRVVLLFVGLMVAMSAVGIDLTALSVLGGAVGVGLGFGLQKVAANYVSGFVILAEHSMRIGDVIKVDNFEGRITDIRTRYTVIRALNGREAIVPNEMLITQRVENASLADPKVAIDTQVQVAYGTDVRRLKPMVEAALVKVPRVLRDPAPNCQLAAFGADGMDLRIFFWIEDPENGQGNVRSEVNLALLGLFDELGVKIPFPQRVVHQAPAAAEPSTGSAGTAGASASPGVSGGSGASAGSGASGASGAPAAALPLARAPGLPESQAPW